MEFITKILGCSPRRGLTKIANSGLVVAIAFMFTFDIDAEGFVKNIEVLDKSHQAFVENSLDALSEWRYAPKVEEGQPVTTTELSVRLDFSISR